jgi:superfamily I DNA and/or RNA helicase
LDEFSKPDDIGSFCSTVDGFQGAEADIVVVSLVRNNGESYPRSALGFLLDSRRMNVLLSRAKYQLIIVGAYGFLSYWSRKIENEEIKRGNSDNKFLVELVKQLDEYKNKRTMEFVGYKRLLKALGKRRKGSLKKSRRQ